MDIVYIVVLSLASIIEMFILCKLMGYRQLSQLNMFDYINGITIGNIAAEMATSYEDNFIHPMTAMIVYAFAAIFLSWISSKSIRMRYLLSGKPIILLNHDQLYVQNLRKSKIDLNEFLSQCRVNGFFDLSQLESAILEENGHISFLPKSEYRPITPGDLQITPPKDLLNATLIIDGNPMLLNLKACGKDTFWLNKELKKHNISKIQDVFLAIYNPNDQLTVYGYNKYQMPPDILS